MVVGVFFSNVQLFGRRQWSRHCSGRKYGHQRKCKEVTDVFKAVSHHELSGQDDGTDTAVLRG